jgi:hypothetical protein
VEDGLISENDFRDFVFANAVRFWGESNPNFFAGTAVAAEASALLTEGTKRSETDLSPHGMPAAARD